MDFISKESNKFSSLKSENNSHLRTDVEKVLENRIIQLRAENESCLKTINLLQAQNTNAQQQLSCICTHLNEFATLTESEISINLPSSSEQIEYFFSKLKAEKHFNNSTETISNLQTDEFQQEKQRLKQQIHVLCTEQTTLKNALDSAKSQVFSLVQKLSCVRNELISAEEEHRKQMLSLTSSLEQEKNTILASDKERNEALNNLLFCKEDLHKLKIHLKDEKDKNVKLEQKLKAAVEEKNKLLNENILLTQALNEANDRLNLNSYVLNDNNKEIEVKIQHLEKENERLRKHLMKMEERYTQETLDSEKEKLKLVDQINKLNSQIANHLTVEGNIKSNSEEMIANLTERLKSLTLERDGLKKETEEAKQTINQYSSSITNLHAVLEQYEKNQHVIQLGELEKCRRDLNAEQHKSAQLLDKIHCYENDAKLMKERLIESNERQKTIDSLNQQMNSLQSIIQEKEVKLNIVQSKLNKLTNDNSIKIDKLIMKNLIMGYLHAPSSKKHEAMIIIGKYLDFSTDEINNVTENGGWLDHVRQQRSQNVHSFSELFIDFLEKESRPQIVGLKMINENIHQHLYQQSSDIPLQQNVLDKLSQPQPPHFYFEHDQHNKQPIQMFLQSLKQNHNNLQHHNLQQQSFQQSSCQLQEQITTNTSTNLDSNVNNVVDSENITTLTSSKPLTQL